MGRKLYLAAYDVSQASRRASLLHLVREYAVGGQKSVHEVYLTDSEREDLIRIVATVIDYATDKFLLLRLDGRLPIRTLGVASAPRDANYFLVA